VATARTDGTRVTGCDSSNPQNCSLCRGDAMAQAQDAMEEGLVIYTIFVGNDTYQLNNGGGLLLQWIADLTDNRKLDGAYTGTRNLPTGYGAPLSPSPTQNYYRAADYDELQAAYDSILKKIYTRLVQ
jgi:hypothetical protein